MLSSTGFQMGGQMLSTGASVAGSFAQSGALRSQGRYEQAVQERNARMAELEAADAARRGDRAALDRLADGRRLEGRQLAVQAASGVDPSTGSAAAVREASQASAQRDAIDIRSNAFNEAWGLRVEADERRSAGQAARDRGRNQAHATAATAGFRAARGLFDMGYSYAKDPYFLESMRPKKGAAGGYAAPPAGKSMSNPRER